MNKFVLLHINNQQDTTMKKAFLILLLMVFFTNTITASFIITDHVITFNTNVKRVISKKTGEFVGEGIAEAAKFTLKLCPLENVDEKIIISIGGKETTYIIDDISITTKENYKVKVYRIYLKNTDLSILLSYDGIMSIIALSRDSSDLMPEYFAMGENNSKFLKEFDRLLSFVDTILDGDYRYRVCSYCSGIGVCSSCRGKKVVEDIFESGTCGTCNGTGRCFKCDGKGH